ncbi:hypothetical protein BD311DRAFT_335039 [Dichomitus squalens]|uniref:Uncharacterized protein n=1 Tax=Dichomitus squalens TaxID=114155 RepID=A0A4Q9MP24_9APHY|nr:hypothetical protein BD311DRAFT_335039 [Dichomitus squalens]
MGVDLHCSLEEASREHTFCLGGVRVSVSTLVAVNDTRSPPQSNTKLRIVNSHTSQVFALQPSDVRCFSQKVRRANYWRRSIEIKPRQSSSCDAPFIPEAMHNGRQAENTYKSVRRDLLGALLLCSISQKRMQKSALPLRGWTAIKPCAYTSGTVDPLPAASLTAHVLPPPYADCQLEHRCHSMTRLASWVIILRHCTPMPSQN